MERGFTLIELVVVIVILGILAASALPRFVDLSSDAEKAAVAAVAGAISSASNLNYSAYKMDPSKGVPIADCADATKLLEGGLPPNYSMSPLGFPLPIAKDVPTKCTVTKTVNSTTYTADSWMTGV